jgi:hypothetical protein
MQWQVLDVQRSYAETVNFEIIFYVNRDRLDLCVNVRKHLNVFCGGIGRHYAEEAFRKTTTMLASSSPVLKPSLWLKYENTKAILISLYRFHRTDT